MRKSKVFIDGYSESAWKSLVVKSLRIGWVDGIIEAKKHIAKSTVNSLLFCGLFEDVFPAGYKELNECVAYILIGDYEKLCSYGTHHTKGLSDPFCDLADEAVKNAPLYAQKMMYEITKHSSIKFLPPRIMNCVYTWLKLKPEVSERRDVLRSPFVGMPVSVLDGHTYEGKKAKKDCLLLSGHYPNHRLLGQRMMNGELDDIRSEFMEELVISERANIQTSMF